VRFKIRVLEVAVEYINTWDADLFTRDLAEHADIVSFDELEAKLSEYLDDYAVLVNASKLGY
jgi:hypothetical protein